MPAASPICRGKNLTLETVLAFVNAIPMEAMEKESFMQFGEARLRGWTQTHSQIARQMALYYEDNQGICHPRFMRKVSILEVLEYATHWAKHYFVPNPYTPSLENYEQTNIYAYIKEQCKSKEISFETMCNNMFGVQLNNTDKVRVYLTNFTDLIIDNDQVFVNDSVAAIDSTLHIHPMITISSYEDYFNYFSIELTNPPTQLTREVSEAKVVYLSAIRTKPFLLLAGISGTGKSRIVKELAYSNCPNQGVLRSDPTSPGNYCLVEVKPNWNDSTELLGYETVLEGGGYHLTKFVKFIIKAMQYEDVPFFVCLDEMNLAPVEQYFAEFLSVLESRKDVVKDGKNTIQSEPLIDATIFRKYKHKLHAELFSTDKEEVSIGYSCPMSDEETPIYFNEVYTRLMDEGLRIPQNLIVVGTVNMDDTTYQFSRKVIDRAMTIEMNEVNLDNMFDSNKADTLNYPDEVVDKDWFFAPYAQSDKALSMIEEEERIQLINKIKEVIGQTDVTGTVTPNSLEVILGKTPFRIAYRVVNELVLHFYALRWQDKDASFDELFKIAFDNILMMKVLPRIEGNEDLVKNPLSALMDWTSGLYPRSNQKIIEMKNRLDIQHFTSFWP